VEDRQILQGIADFIAAHGDSRFSPIKDLAGDPAKVVNRAGYTDQPSGCDHRVFLFNSQALKQAANGYGEVRICTALEAAGAIEVVHDGDKKRYQKQYRLPTGGKARFYAIDPEKLQPH
jgi:hypothetical protein